MEDHIKRWMTADGSFRILVAHSTNTVAQAAETAQTVPSVTDVYGRLLTGTALLQLAQSPIDRVQAAIEHNGPCGQLLADVWPGPTVRGRVENPSPPGSVVLDSDCVVKVSRQPARGGNLYQSVVPIQSGAVADALQQYTLESEQVLTLFSLATVVDEHGDVQRAGGMIVQAMPGWEREHLAKLTQCLERASFEDLVRSGDTPFDAAHAIFHDQGLHETGADPLQYRCRCSKAVAISAIQTLSATEIEALRNGGQEVVTCDFCGKEYVVVGADLDA